MPNTNTNEPRHAITDASGDYVRAVFASDLPALYRADSDFLSNATGRAGRLDVDCEPMTQEHSQWTLSGDDASMIRAALTTAF